MPRRKFLIASGAMGLSVIGCAAAGPTATRAAAPIAVRAAPWVGQFLFQVGVNVASELIPDLFRRSGDDELGLMEPARDQLERGRFIDPFSTHFEAGRGVGEVYSSDTRVAFCQVDAAAEYETCVALCNFRERTWVAVEGPALGALFFANSFLRDEGFPTADIDALLTPLELAKPRGEIEGEELRFETKRAVRRYRTKKGTVDVTWDRNPDGTGSSEVHPSGGFPGIDVGAFGPEADEV